MDNGGEKCFVFTTFTAEAPFPMNVHTIINFRLFFDLDLGSGLDLVFAFDFDSDFDVFALIFIFFRRSSYDFVGFPLFGEKVPPLKINGNPRRVRSIPYPTSAPNYVHCKSITSVSDAMLTTF